MTLALGLTALVATTALAVVVLKEVDRRVRRRSQVRFLKTVLHDHLMAVLAEPVGLLTHKVEVVKSTQPAGLLTHKQLSA
ncbi:MAG: hypothetical protein ACR2NZ_19675 [Rubripirellula sp.]